MYSITQANQADAMLIHELVYQIYEPTYQDILSSAQIQFMLEKSYAIEALQHTIAFDQDFFIIHNEAQIPVGFMAVKEKEEATDIMRIEKLYLLPETQGKGYGRAFIDYAKDVAIERNKSILELNVNRGNKAYYFYLKMGFKVIQEVDIPYYGYILDDYVMQKNLKA